MHALSLAWSLAITWWGRPTGTVSPASPQICRGKDVCRPVCRPPLQLLLNAKSRRGAIPVAFTGTGVVRLKRLPGLPGPQPSPFSRGSSDFSLSPRVRQWRRQGMPLYSLEYPRFVIHTEYVANKPNTLTNSDSPLRNEVQKARIRSLASSSARASRGDGLPAFTLHGSTRQPPPR
jgi:hypothetical protein